MSKYNVPGLSRIPFPIVMSILATTLGGGIRRPEVDGAAVWASLNPPGRLTGSENVPSEVPLLIVANHYNGPGLWVGFSAALLAHGVAVARPQVEIRGVGVESYPDLKVARFLPVPEVITRLAFRRFYAVYGVISLPKGDGEAMSRAGTVRRILRTASEGAALIIFPEGRNTPDFAMQRVKPGVGKLLQIMTRRGISIVPAAVFEKDSVFSVCFGPRLDLESRGTSLEIEQLVGAAIARMLPENLRGEYSRSPLESGAS